jgi:hypothetical protein
VSKLVRRYKEELTKKLTNRESESARFAPPGTAEKFFTDSVLRELFAEVLKGEADFRGRRASEPIEDICTAIRRETTPEHGLCTVLAILVYAECDRDELKSFARKYMTRGSDDHLLFDGNLPFSKQDARRLFGEQLGDDFYGEQFAFTPFVFVEGEENDPSANVTGEPLRLPFIEDERVEIGKGQFSTVYMIPVEHGGWKSKHGTYNEPIWLAQKVYTFEQQEMGMQAYESEYKILEEAGNSSTENKYLTYSLGSLKLANEYSVFFPLAGLNLNQLLTLEPRYLRRLRNLKAHQAIRIMKSNQRDHVLALPDSCFDELSRLSYKDFRRLLELPSNKLDEELQLRVSKRPEDPTARGAGPSSQSHAAQIRHEAAEILNLMACLCEGIGHLHNGIRQRGQNKSIYHCDVRPPNILLFKEGLKIADLGLSRLRFVDDVFQPKHTTESEGTGTFVSPEVILEKRGSTFSDLWSLGAILMVTTTWFVAGPEGVQILRKCV